MLEIYTLNKLILFKMSKLSISLKLGTPKNRKLSPHKNS